MIATYIYLDRGLHVSDEIGLQPKIYLTPDIIYFTEVCYCVVRLASTKTI